MMKKVILPLLFTLLVVVSSQAQTAEEIYQQGNQAYLNEEYSYAIELYQQVLDSGMMAPELYYNLGNAYFRENQIGPAILNYERALRLQPNDENIQHNLEVAREQTVDLIEPVPVIFYERWWRSFILLFSVNEWSYAAIGGLFLLIISLSFYLLTSSRAVKKATFGASLIFLLLSAGAFTAAHYQYQHLYKKAHGIIFSPRVMVKSAPGEASQDLLVIHEGTRVSITDHLGEWYEVRLENGSVGWVSKSSVEVI
ncbi:MAG: tetratricopeptide repeat protein [Bacteroidales bacterium]